MCASCWDKTIYEKTEATFSKEASPFCHGIYFVSSSATLGLPEMPEWESGIAADVMHTITAGDFADGVELIRSDCPAYPARGTDRQCVGRRSWKPRRWKRRGRRTVPEARRQTACVRTGPRFAPRTGLIIGIDGMGQRSCVQTEIRRHRRDGIILFCQPHIDIGFSFGRHGFAVFKEALIGDFVVIRIAELVHFRRRDFRMAGLFVGKALTGFLPHQNAAAVAQNVCA